MTNNKNPLIYVLLGIAVIIGGWWLLNNSSGTGQPSGEAASVYSSSVLTADHTSFDFETVTMSGGKVEHDYTLVNQGTESISIEKIITSCMCTEATVIDDQGKTYGPFGMPGHGGAPSTNVSVKPGSTVIIKVVFDPAAHGPSGVGFIQRNIYVDTNSSTAPKVELSFKAMVTN